MTDKAGNFMLNKRIYILFLTLLYPPSKPKSIFATLQDFFGAFLALFKIISQRYM